MIKPVLPHLLAPVPLDLVQGFGSPVPKTRLIERGKVVTSCSRLNKALPLVLGVILFPSTHKTVDGKPPFEHIEHLHPSSTSSTHGTLNVELNTDLFFKQKDSTYEKEKTSPHPSQPVTSLLTSPSSLPPSSLPPSSPAPSVTPHTPRSAELARSGSAGGRWRLWCSLARSWYAA
jgi:hypothetical protein